MKLLPSLFFKFNLQFAFLLTYMYFTLDSGASMAQAGRALAQLND